MKTHNLAVYLSDYINEELERGNEIDVYTLRNAIEAFEGGAANDNSTHKIDKE